MLTVFAILLTTACVALTVAFLGTLRGVTEVRLRLAGAGNEGTQFHLDSGTGLPESLLAAMPDQRELGLLLFMSEDCAACWHLIDELPGLQLDGAPVTVCLTGPQTDKMRERLGRGFNVVDTGVAAEAVKQFRIESTPIVIVHRDGYVLGSAHGSSAESVGTIQRLWSASQAPDSLVPHQARPLTPESITVSGSQRTTPGEGGR